MSHFISLVQLAKLAGISRQAVEKAATRQIKGQHALWRGSRLVIRTFRGPGGRSGWSYEVRVDSLPADLQARLKELQRPVQLALKLDDPAAAEREWRHALIMPAITHPPRSAERRAVVRAILATEHIRDGRRVKVPERTVLRWLADFDAAGLAGLNRKKRADAGEAAVLLTRRWDKAMATLPEPARAEIAGTLPRFIMSRWADGCSYAVVKRLAEERLAKLTREAGSDLSAPELVAACELPKHLVERGRADGRKVFTRLRDAKGHDDQLPRVRQTSRGQPPMYRVIGDAHHVDVYLRREDGSLATPKAIAWLDASTHRLRIDLVLCETGTSIRNADLIQSFIDMTQDPHWGVPQSLHLDNGSEYNFADMLGDPLRLAAIGCNFSPLVRAQPYNPAAKGLLEGAFRALERILVPLKGSVPGNRLITRSANLGKPPEPFDGSFEEFARTFSALLTLYNTQKQKGDLRGLSPQGAYAKAVAEGWTRMDIDGDALRTAFSVKETRTVMRGKLSVGGELFYCDGLSRHNGEKVTIQRPKYLRWEGVPVFDRKGTFIGVAHFDEEHQRGASSGPIESARRRKVAFDTSAALVGELDDEDAVKLMIASAEAQPAPPVPESGGKIRLHEDAERIGAALRETPGETRKRRMNKVQQEQAARIKLLEQAGF